MQSIASLMSLSQREDDVAVLSEVADADDVSEMWSESAISNICELAQRLSTFVISICMFHYLPIFILFKFSVPTHPY